jgi:glycosyltransferase involved in cell wall biosynthesis
VAATKASVIIATYNRKARLAALLGTLARQDLPRAAFEVVVVDDGSREEAAPAAEPFRAALEISVLRQENAGVAVARQRGVERCQGRIVIFLDDDMLVQQDFVRLHLEAHEGHDDRVVMGRLLPDARLREMPLFERFHARMLDRMAREFAARGTFRGHDVYTGNLSLSKALFLRAGGFDPSFHIEDVELGVRLEAAGASFVFSTEASSVHASDHTSLESWLRRSARDGRDWVKLARRHQAAVDASPWRHFRHANPALRPFFAAAVALPALAPPLSRAVLRGAAAVDRVGLDRAAVAATTAAYGLQYFAGVREETGGLREVIAAYRGYRRAAREGAR